MNDRIPVGIDYGSLELRVMYASQGVPQSLPLPANILEPAVAFSRQDAVDELDFSFPSVARSIGSDGTFSFGETNGSPAAVVQSALATMHKILCETTGKAVGQAVFAVPAMLSQQSRAALLQGAQAAGFESASLIDTCTAAALAYQGARDESATVVAYDLDYGDCEYALLRFVRGRCRTVGRGWVPGVSGQVFDVRMIKAMIYALREKRLYLGLKQLRPVYWLHLRSLAESIRKLFAQGKTVRVSLPQVMTGFSQLIELMAYGDGWGAAVAGEVERTLEAVLNTLEQNELSFSDLDAVIVTGCVARTSPIFEILQYRCPGRLHRPDPQLVATGALLQACHLGEQPLDVPPTIRGDLQVDPQTAGLYQAERLVAAQGIPVVQVLGDFDPVSTPQRREAAEKLARAVAENEHLRQSRELAAGGQPDEALAVLDALERELKATREQVRKSLPSAAERVLKEAERLLESGRQLEAVATSHRAFALDSEDPAVFKRMMVIHEKAGLSLTEPEQYPDAIRTLECAHRHDQTDRAIHRALARRHYLHALAMKQRRNDAKAQELVQVALSFDPKDPEALRLLDELLAPPTDTLGVAGQ